MLDQLWALPTQLAWLAFACALVAVIAQTNRRQRRALGMGILLMAVVGLTYQVTTSLDLTARGRPTISGFVDRLTEPTALNTGTLGGALTLASTTTLPTGMTYSSGTFNADQPNAVYVGLDFADSWVAVRAADVTFIGCRFRGGPAGTANRGVVSCVSANCVRARFLMCTIRPDNPTAYLTGIQGHDWYAYRCDISRTVDPFRTQNPSVPSGPVNTLGDCCYLHDWYYQSPFSGQPSDLQTHNDGHQQSNGSNSKTIGCAIWGYCDPAVSSPSGPENISGKVPNVSGKGNGQNVLALLQLTPDAGPISDVELAWCWLYGATVKIQATQRGRGAILGLKIHHNRVADDGTRDNFAIIDQSTLDAAVAAGTLNDNYWTSGPRAGQLIGVGTQGFYGRADS